MASSSERTFWQKVFGQDPRHHELTLKGHVMNLVGRIILVIIAAQTFLLIISFPHIGLAVWPVMAIYIAIFYIAINRLNDFVLNHWTYAAERRRTGQRVSKIHRK